MITLRRLAFSLSAVALLTVSGGCSDIFSTGEDDDDAVEEGGSESIVTETYDGQAPFAWFKTEPVSLPARYDGMFEVELYTNMYAPQFEVNSSSGADFVYVAGMIGPDTENEGYCIIYLEIYPNLENVSRSSVLAVKAADGQEITCVELIQQPAPGCELDGEPVSTYNSLTFRFNANPQTRFVRYYLSDSELSDSEAAAILYDSYEYSSLHLEEGETSFELVFENLEPAAEYYLYLRPFDEKGQTVEDNYFMAFSASTALPEGEQQFVLTVSANPANSYTVYLPFQSDYARGVLDWGDGTTESFDGSWKGQFIFHKYEGLTGPAEFDVRFSGSLTRLYMRPDAPESARENTLIAVKQWGYTGLEDIDLSDFTSLVSVAADELGAFANVKDFGISPYGGSFSDTGIKEIPEGFFDYARRATSFDDTFRGCGQLTSIPEGLFDNCASSRSFDSTFSGCSKLEYIPDGLFVNCPYATNFRMVFAGTAIKSIPADLFSGCPGIEHLEGAFYDCEYLAEIPSGLLSENSKVKYVGDNARRNSTYQSRLGMFERCSSLVSIPVDLFAGCPDLSDASCVFCSCTSLQEIPSGLFKENGNLTYMESSFEDCRSLVRLPVDMFDSNRGLVDVSYLFSGCESLTGESPYTMVGETKVHLYERSGYNLEFVNPDDFYNCFAECENLSDYGTMPDNWK